MRQFKIFIFFSLLVLSGCDDIPTDKIDKQSVDYVVENISVPDLFVFSEENKSLTAQVTIGNSRTVKAISFEITSVDGYNIINYGNEMIPNNGNDTKIYTGSALLAKGMLTSDYMISFFVEDNINPNGANLKKVGYKTFKFQSEAENFAPVISNLIMPVEVQRETSFIFSINVNDPNGKNDLAEVYFELLRPDSSIVYSDVNQQNKKFPLFDNGDFTNAGDQIAGDGIYSLRNSFGGTSQTGNWYFQFNAVDKSGLISNTISYSLKVK